MGKLRDIFAAIGLCESTANLKRKPELINYIISYSAQRVDRSLESRAQLPYESRLRMALEQSSVYALDTLIKNEVVVCLDLRMGIQNSSFFTSHIYSGFYCTPTAKVLALYDTGKDPSRSGFFEESLIDHCGDAIDQLADILNSKWWKSSKQPSFLGTTRTRYNAATKMTETYFDWSRFDTFPEALKRNPNLTQPPVKPVGPKVEPRI